jgi:hypothetical protein
MSNGNTMGRPLICCLKMAVRRPAAADTNLAVQSPLLRPLGWWRFGIRAEVVPLGFLGGCVPIRIVERRSGIGEGVRKKSDRPLYLWRRAVRVERAGFQWTRRLAKGSSVVRRQAAAWRAYPCSPYIGSTTPTLAIYLRLLVYLGQTSY